MNKVNVFISSTCYDLAQVRTDLKDFFIHLGHNPILSEEKNFPIDPNLNNTENCINAVKNIADIFILIIGNRYGCTIDSGRSITNMEFLTAVEKGIPIYTFTLKEMLVILPVWEKNENGDFSSFVDDIRIFTFIKEVRKNSGLWNFSFERAQDIMEVLRAQFSNLFNEALSFRKKVLTLANQDLYSKVSSNALKILLEKDDGFEPKFFMQCAYDEIQKYKSLKTDYHYSIVVKSSDKISCLKEYTSWSLLKFGQVKNIINSLNNLIHQAFPYYFAEPGISSNIDGLYYIAQTYGRLYSALLEWAIDVQSIIIEEEYTESRDILAELPKKAIREMEEFPLKSLNQINKTLKEKTTGRISLVLTLDIDEQFVNKHDIALNKLGILLEKGLLS